MIRFVDHPGRPRIAIPKTPTARRSVSRVSPIPTAVDYHHPAFWRYLLRLGRTASGVSSRWRWVVERDPREWRGDVPRAPQLS